MKLCIWCFLLANPNLCIGFSDHPLKFCSQFTLVINVFWSQLVHSRIQNHFRFLPTDVKAVRTKMHHSFNCGSLKTTWHFPDLWQKSTKMISGLKAILTRDLEDGVHDGIEKSSFTILFRKMLYCPLLSEVYLLNTNHKQFFVISENL